jgi:hypothetical protein
VSDDAVRELTEKLDQLRRGRESPRDPERELGEGLLGELNRSCTRWYPLDELGDDDDAA